MIRSEHLNQILDKVQAVPTLPAVVLRVMQMIEDPLCSTAALAQVIQADPALAIKVLRLANSAFYGFRQRITTVPQAVSLLGFSTLKNALLSAAVFDLFRAGVSGFDLPALWQHSVATAMAAKLLARHARLLNTEQAFTAGLLHDVGKVMIARYLPMALLGIVQAVRDENLPMAVAEQRALGVAHPEFGAAVMARWGLPPLLVEAVEFHHRPTCAKDSFDMAAVVYLANVLAHRAGIGSGGDALPREVDPLILGHFGLGERALADLGAALLGKRLEIQDFAAAAA